MMKIRNAISNDDSSDALASAGMARSEDVAFIQLLVQRTIVPRHYVIEQNDNLFEFVAANKQLVAFKAAQGFQYIDASADMSARNDIARNFINTLDELSDDDELTIKRVGTSLLAGMPEAGADLNNIDLSTDVVVTPDTPTGHTLRIVVDNERNEDEIVETQNASTVDPVLEKESPANATGAVRMFYKHMRVHANYTLLKSRDGKTLDSYGVLPEIETAVLDGIVDDLGAFDNMTSNGFGTAPKMITMMANRQENVVMVYVISQERVLIAEITTAKLGRVVMDWNALLATKAENG